MSDRNPAILKSPRHMRQIFHQGEYDGACFLYAIANAYYALTGRKPTLAEWDRAVLALPAPRFFLCGYSGGTPVHFKQDTALLEWGIRTVFEQFDGEQLIVEAHPAINTVASVGLLLGKQSVAMLCYRGSTDHQIDLHHWVLATGYEHGTGQLHLACSARYTEASIRPDDAYLELHQPLTNFWSNDTISDPSKLLIEDGTVFRLARP